MMGVKRLCLHP